MLIFLDIDGVMVPAKSWTSPKLLDDGFPAFSSVAVRALKSLIDSETNIVLTTSHKAKYSIKEWKNIFASRGLEVNNLTSLNSDSLLIKRKDEILNWFNINNLTKDFLIIDDDKSLNDLPKYLKDNLVLTRPLIGLTESDLSEVKYNAHKRLQIA